MSRRRAFRLRERAAPRGALDLPVDGARLATRSCHVQGWVLFPDEATARVDVWIDGGSPQPARIGLPREDVAAVHDGADGHRDALISGFELHLRRTHLRAAGAAELRVVATGMRGRRFGLPPVTVNIAPPPGMSGEARARAHELQRRQRTPSRAPEAGRLLAVSHHLGRGGAVHYLVDLVKRLAARELAITMMSPLDGVQRGVLEQHGAAVHVSSPHPLSGPDAYEGRMAELMAWAAQRRFSAVLANTIDSFPAVDMAVRLGLPALWSLHESFEPEAWWAEMGFEHEGYDYAYERLIYALRHASATLYPAEATRRLYAPYVNPEAMHTLPWGIELDAIDPHLASVPRTAARERLGLPAEGTLVVCLGIVQPRKAQTVLVQAFAEIAHRHPDARLVVVGESGAHPHYVASLRDYASSLGMGRALRVLPATNDPYDWHLAADVVVLGSDVESRPLTLVEAMAFGTPVLATRIFGVSDLVEDGRTGWLCEPRDLADLAHALDRVLGLSAAQRRAVGEAASARVRAEPMADEQAAHVEALLGALMDARAGAAQASV